jgi:hypothetical protein
MESDIIRSEIDKTLLRIGYRIQLIEQRARDAARVALIWSAVTVTAVGVIAGVAVWRYRRRGSARRDLRERSHGLRQAPLSFGRAGIARGRAQPES